MKPLISVVLLALAPATVASPEPNALVEANDETYRAWFFSPEERAKVSQDLPTCKTFRLRFIQRSVAWKASRRVSLRNNPIYNPLARRVYNSPDHEPNTLA